MWSASFSGIRIQLCVLCVSLSVTLHVACMHSHAQTHSWEKHQGDSIQIIVSQYFILRGQDSYYIIDKKHEYVSFPKPQAEDSVW